MQMLVTLIVLALTGTALAGHAGRGQAPTGGVKMKPPAIIKNVPPVYPPEARAARIEGRVVVEATIGPAGTVVDAKVVRSIPLLDQAALDAVKQWVYEPTLINGKAVPVVMTVTVNFVLDAAAAKPAEPPPSFDALLDAARFAEAEAIARTAAEHLELGRRLADTASLAGPVERARNLARAEDLLKRAIELATDATLRAQAMTRLHGYYTADNPARTAEAEPFFKSLAERYPDDPTPQLLLAGTLFTKNTMAQYVEAMRRIAVRFPKNPEVRAGVATALRDQVTMNPKTPPPQRRTLLSEARTWTDEGLKLDPENQLALLTKALVLRDLAGLENDPKRKKALEDQAQRLIEQEGAIAARKPK